MREMGIHIYLAGFMEHTVSPLFFSPYIGGEGGAVRKTTYLTIASLHPRPKKPTKTFRTQSCTVQKRASKPPTQGCGYPNFALEKKKDQTIQRHPNLTFPPKHPAHSPLRTKPATQLFTDRRAGSTATT